jgi:3-deoxy-manno-octulosonate cytidylyltransferase (CMP-KDO synthetase)
MMSPSERRALRIVIPSRFGSTRLPGKPLIDLGGEPMIARVYSRVRRALPETEVVVAIDDERIADELRRRQIAFAMTDSGHQSGTDRVAEIAKASGWLPDDIVINVQGDEPLVPVALLQEFAVFCESVPRFEMATVACPVKDAIQIDDPNIVKLVVDREGRALYFSRAPIPLCRDGRPAAVEGVFRRHVGIYGYQNAALQRLATSEPCELESLEKLEQLRALWLGLQIHVMHWPEPPPHGVDTPEDVERILTMLKRQGHESIELY